MLQKHDKHENLSRYVVFPREEWAQLRGNTPLTLSEGGTTGARTA